MTQIGHAKISINKYACLSKKTIDKCIWFHIIRIQDFEYKFTQPARAVTAYPVLNISFGLASRIHFFEAFRQKAPELRGKFRWGKFIFLFEDLN